MTNATEKPLEPAPIPPAQDKIRKDEAGTDKPEELTEEELRLMADTMPGDCPGDD